jgi:hypothetical protein
MVERKGYVMLIVVPAGYVLTSGGQLVPGGPSCIVLGAGMRMDSGGRIWSEFPQFVQPPLQQPEFKWA